MYPVTKTRLIGFLRYIDIPQFCRTFPDLIVPFIEIRTFNAIRFENDEPTKSVTRLSERSQHPN